MNIGLYPPQVPTLTASEKSNLVTVNTPANAVVNNVGVILSSQGTIATDFLYTNNLLWSNAGSTWPSLNNY